eukprot:1716632-Pyramimonas_sp.AAC.4
MPVEFLSYPLLQLPGRSIETAKSSLPHTLGRGAGALQDLCISPIYHIELARACLMMCTQ